MRILEKLKLRFSIRHVLLGVLFISIALTLYVRSVELRGLAAEHHLTAMENGFLAAQIQRPPSFEHDWKFPSVALTDAATIAEASPHWLALMQHEEIRDIYLRVSRAPWMPLPSKRINQINAKADIYSKSNLNDLWTKVIKPHINENGYFDLANAHKGFEPGGENRMLTNQLLTGERWLRTTLPSAYDGVK